MWQSMVKDYKKKYLKRLILETIFVLWNNCARGYILLEDKDFSSDYSDWLHTYRSFYCTKDGGLIHMGA